MLAWASVVKAEVLRTVQILGIVVVGLMELLEGLDMGLQERGGHSDRWERMERSRLGVLNIYCG